MGVELSILLIPRIPEERPLTQIFLAKLFKASPFICVYVLSSLKVESKMSALDLVDKGFYSSRVEGFNQTGEFGKQIGRVTES